MLLDHGAADSASRPTFVTVDSWLLYTLAGGPANDVVLTESSNASRTLLLNLATLEWSAPMMALFGVERDMLADLQPSASHFASVSADVIPELAGVPITGILGDQQAALFGQACFKEGLVKATYGTGAFVLVNAGHDVPDVVDGLLTTVAWQTRRTTTRIVRTRGFGLCRGVRPCSGYATCALSTRRTTSKPSRVP